MNLLQQAFSETPAASLPVASSSFYTAMRILPRAQRQAMYEGYAFCRAVDDIADGSGPRPGLMAALARWRDDFGRLYAGLGVSDRTRGLENAIEPLDLRFVDFLRVIGGTEMDVWGDIRAPDWETLDLDCDRV